jgi:hypothetical protein
MSTGEKKRRGGACGGSLSEREVIAGGASVAGLVEALEEAHHRPAGVATRARELALEYDVARVSSTYLEPVLRRLAARLAAQPLVSVARRDIRLTA